MKCTTGITKQHRGIKTAAHVMGAGRSIFITLAATTTIPKNTVML